MIPPIINPDTLTDEQKERIAAWWESIALCYLNHIKPSYDGMARMFADLFGQDFFKNLKQKQFEDENSNNKPRHTHR